MGVMTWHWRKGLTEKAGEGGGKKSPWGYRKEGIPGRELHMREHLAKRHHGCVLELPAVQAGRVGAVCLRETSNIPRTCDPNLFLPQCFLEEVVSKLI